MFFKTTAAESKSAAGRWGAEAASVFNGQYTTDFARLFLCDSIRAGGGSC